MRPGKLVKRMEHRHVERGNYNFKGEADGINHSIKTGRSYTLKRNSDADLANLRSRAMGRASAGRRTGPTTQIWFGLDGPADPLIRRSKAMLL